MPSASTSSPNSLPSFSNFCAPALHAGEIVGQRRHDHVTALGRLEARLGTAAQQAELAVLEQRQPLALGQRVAGQHLRFVDQAVQRVDQVLDAAEAGIGLGLPDLEHGAGDQVAGGIELLDVTVIVQQLRRRDDELVEELAEDAPHHDARVEREQVLERRARAVPR